MAAPEFSLRPGCAEGEKGKKRGQIRKIWASEASPAVATLSPTQITSRLDSLAYFPPDGESGPGFKYDFINSLPFPRFFFKFLLKSRQIISIDTSKKSALKLGDLPRLKVKQVKIYQPHKSRRILQCFTDDFMVVFFAALYLC